jgi:tRNA(Ile)-lysidine synthase
VLAYLKARRLTWREDASNRDVRYLRNRVRHVLLPLLEKQFNPGIRKVLLRTAEILRAEAANEPVAAERRAIRRQLGATSFRQVEEARKRLPAKWPVQVRGKTVIPELGVSLAFRPARSEGPRQPRASGVLRCAQNDKRNLECFDADALGPRPFVRTWRVGDRFQPLGMTGQKKLQDFFVDAKVPREERCRVALLCATDGRVAWVVGYRLAEPFKVTAKTRRVVRIRVSSLTS